MFLLMTLKGTHITNSFFFDSHIVSEKCFPDKVKGISGWPELMKPVLRPSEGVKATTSFLDSKAS